MSDVEQRTLNILRGEQLISVTFVLDYVQLHFDSPCFNALIWPEVIIDDQVYRIESPGYRDALCSLIARRVKDFHVEREAFAEIVFDPAGAIRLSLRAEDYVGPEALVFVGGDLYWVE